MMPSLLELQWAEHYLRYYPLSLATTVGICRKQLYSYIYAIYDIRVRPCGTMSIYHHNLVRGVATIIGERATSHFQISHLDIYLSGLFSSV